MPGPVLCFLAARVERIPTGFKLLDKQIIPTL